MGVQMMRELTCDNCFGNVLIPVNQITNFGYGAVRVNGRAPLSALDSDGWQDFLLCPACFNKILQQLPLPAVKEEEPVEPF